MTLRRAEHPFQFVTRLNLVELTGLKARTLDDLLSVLSIVPDAVVYEHTHHFLKQHQFLSPEPPNDFAYWVTTSLNEDRLGEQLAAIDTIQFTSLSALRDRLVSVITRYLDQKRTPSPVAPEAETFHFRKSRSFMLPTPYQVFDLLEFQEALQKVSIHSIYHHIFEARLRLGKGTNDFSSWLSKELGEGALATSLARMDPYTQSLESLRQQMVRMLTRHVA